MKKMQYNTYNDRFEVDKNFQFFCVCVIPNYSKNTIVYLQHFGAINTAHYKACHCFIFLVITSLNMTKNFLFLYKY